MNGQATLDEEEFRRWRTEADRALQGARVMADAGLHNWSCFAAEQAAQLGLKALLHGLGRGPWGHDVVRLGEWLTEAGLQVAEDLADRLRRLARHYIPARYPDAHPSGPPGAHYGASDSRQAVQDARAVLEFVDGSWGELGG